MRKIDWKVELWTRLDRAERAGLLPPSVSEFKPLTNRQYRIDRAYVAPYWVAVEYEGLARPNGLSRHTTLVGYSRDCEKYSWLSIAGWTLVRCTAPMVRSGLAERLIREALRQNGWRPPAEEVSP